MREANWIFAWNKGSSEPRERACVPEHHGAPQNNARVFRNKAAAPRISLFLFRNTTDRAHTRRHFAPEAEGPLHWWCIRFC